MNVGVMHCICYCGVWVGIGLRLRLGCVRAVDCGGCLISFGAVMASNLDEWWVLLVL